MWTCNSALGTQAAKARSAASPALTSSAAVEVRRSDYLGCGTIRM